MRTIDVRELLGHPGAWKAERLHDTIDGLRTELASVPADAPIDAELVFESVVEGVLASGTLTGTMALRCARCLIEFRQPFHVEVSELFTVGAPDDGDEYPLDPEGDLDPEQMVRDAVGVELPFSPLCAPGCLGLCERCGGDRNRGECACSGVDVDPRWAALEELFASVDVELERSPRERLNLEEGGDA
jgi:uncharacterized protein